MDLPSRIHSKASSAMLRGTLLRQSKWRACSASAMRYTGSAAAGPSRLPMLANTLSLSTSVACLKKGRSITAPYRNGRPSQALLRYESSSTRSSSEERTMQASDSAATSPLTLRERIRPFAELARIDKPTGTLLLFWPCAWSLTMASHALHLPPESLAWNIFLFGTGAFIMRGAGCTVNDLWDRKLDAQVERTRSRPLASGATTPFQAFSFLGLQLSAGLAILLQLNWYSIALGASSLSLVVIYPFMKRITYWPQFVLGLAFNWGALLGWAAMAGTLDHAGMILAPLYAGSICWTLVYDTIYAHQDKTDDVGAGIKSTALLFGEQTKPVLAALSAGMLALFATSVRSLNAAQPMLLNTSASSLHEFLTTGHPFFAAALGVSAAHFAWQLTTVDLASRPDCWSKFRSNTVLGAILWAGLALDYLVQVGLADEEQREKIAAAAS